MAEYEIFGLLLTDNKTEALPNEKTHSLISIVTEIVALAIANIRLKELLYSQAIRDPLTGLLNRRFLDEYVIKQIGQAKRNKTTVSFIMIDVDNFKQINDRFGHESGDYVLSLLGKLLNSLIREEDLVCRYGGEEFLLVLPNCELDNAQRVAETVRQKISEMPITLRGNDLNITVSLGIARFPQNGSSIKRLIAASDQALYAAKKQGKNRTIIFSEVNAPKGKL